MKLLFVHSHIFKYDKDNNFFSSGQFPYKVFKERYLNYFDELVVASRGKKNTVNGQLNLSSGPNVRHFILPNLSNIKKRYKNKKKLKKDLEILIKESDSVVARMPSIYAYRAIKVARKQNKPFVVEVVGDVFSSLWTHGSFLGKVLAPIYYIKYKRIIKQSSNLIYVTQSYLQEKYPYKYDANTINASNVDISFVPEEVLLNKIDRIKIMDINKEINIGLIGSYSSKYKGIDTAIKAVKKLNDRGFNCNLVVLGDGNNKWLKDLSKKLKVENNIIFTGSLPGGKKVFEWLDTMDLYIQPSLTEGLPRALIEAMSRGIPCVASSVGGIPELIEKRFIHTPKSEKDLTEKIEHLLENKEVMIEQAETNYCNAKNYTSEVLNARRKDFWNEFMEKELFKK